MTIIRDREDPREDRGSQLREQGSKDTGQLKDQGETTAVTEAQVHSSLKHLIPLTHESPIGGLGAPLVLSSLHWPQPELADSGSPRSPWGESFGSLRSPLGVLLPFAVFPVHGS